jgi:hypothetical protein
MNSNFQYKKLINIAKAVFLEIEELKAKASFLCRLS